MFAAHTANDAIEVIDCRTNRWLRSIPGLTEVAGALVSEELDLVFTSNRGEDSIGILRPDGTAPVATVPVGLKPNGLAFDPLRGLLLAANVGDAKLPGSHTVSIVDIHKREMIASVGVPGRTRWAIFDPESGAFFVNIADPASIVVIDSANPGRIARTIAVPASGPHGLDLDPGSRRLFCACDDGSLVVYDLREDSVSRVGSLSGPPDVIFCNARLGHLYVAIGEPGLIDVFNTRTMERVETVPTGPGAHTIGYDAATDAVFAFLPADHAAMVLVDAEA